MRNLRTMALAMVTLPLALFACSSSSSDAGGGAAGSGQGGAAGQGGAGGAADSGTGPTCTQDGGGMGATCDTYCTCMMATCTDPANGFTDAAACKTACMALTEDALCCRAYHCGNAMTDATTHCPHAAGKALCQ